jgi:hypothetical protein
LYLLLLQLCIPLPDIVKELSGVIPRFCLHFHPAGESAPDCTFPLLSYFSGDIIGPYIVFYWPKGDKAGMGNPSELESRFRFGPIPIADWIDMEFVLQEVDESIRPALLAAHFEMVANVFTAQAATAQKMMNIVLKGKQKGG